MRTTIRLNEDLLVQVKQIAARSGRTMTDVIEECLQVVIDALGQCDLPANDITAWCAGMLKKDRVGFICDKGLQALHDRFDM